MRTVIAVTMLGALLCLAGCGQKGPLYLPGNGPDSGHDQPQQPQNDDAPEPG